MNKNFGPLLRAHRDELGISRKMLCVGICSEKQLYRIESCLNEPTPYFLEEFSKRLEVNLFELYQSSTTPINADSFHSP